MLATAPSSLCRPGRGSVRIAVSHRHRRDPFEKLARRKPGGSAPGGGNLGRHGVEVLLDLAPSGEVGHDHVECDDIGAREDRQGFHHELVAVAFAQQGRAADAVIGRRGRRERLDLEETRAHGTPAQPRGVVDDFGQRLLGSGACPEHGGKDLGPAVPRQSGQHHARPVVLHRRLRRIGDKIAEAAVTQQAKDRVLHLRLLLWVERQAIDVERTVPVLRGLGLQALVERRQGETGIGQREHQGVRARGDLEPLAIGQRGGEGRVDAQARPQQRIGAREHGGHLRLVVDAQHRIAAAAQACRAPAGRIELQEEAPLPADRESEPRLARATRDQALEERAATRLGIAVPGARRDPQGIEFEAIAARVDGIQDVEQATRPGGRDRDRLGLARGGRRVGGAVALVATRQAHGLAAADQQGDHGQHAPEPPHRRGRIASWAVGAVDENHGCVPATGWALNEGSITLWSEA